MVVDDEKDILSIIKRGLESDNIFKVDTFSSGESALKAFESHSEYYYDIILTDIRMPKMSGFELYRRIKEKRSSTKIDFISKPVSISNLITKLKSMLDTYPENTATL